MPNNENLGPAERIIQTILPYVDHCNHNRCGIVTPDLNSPIGVKWEPASWKEEDGKKIVYKLVKLSRGKSNKVRLGELGTDNIVRVNRQKVAEFRSPGLFPEVASWVYRQAAEVWKVDNEFAAKWASYAYDDNHRDLKVVLAALMLVQSRKGDPVREDGKVLFHDEDYRDVGEAMVLLLRRKDKKDLDAKLLLRIHDLLSLPEIAKINQELGFGRSSRKPFYGRWSKVVEKWLLYREENVRLLEGLVKSGQRKKVMELARRVGYKPLTPKFFETLRWKQTQAKDGRRTLAIGEAVKKSETWLGLSETEICLKIVETRPSYKRIVGMVPPEVGLTRAIVAAAVESNCLSKKDLVILTPTLEELGLLNDPQVKNVWEQAMKAAEDMRAANIATRVKNKELQDKLNETANNAMKTAIEKEMNDLRIYFMIDRSGSMEGAIEQAKIYLEKFLGAFPSDKVHVITFNTVGQVVKINHPSAAGVRQALMGIRAAGGTDYGAAVRTAQQFRPKNNEDVLFIFVGDEGAARFTTSVEQSGLNPTAFGFIKVVNPRWPERRYAVQETATALKIPCFMIDEKTFDDVYAIPRTLRNLIQATPVNRNIGFDVPHRVSLIEQILQTELLKKPEWTLSA